MTVVDTTTFRMLNNAPHTHKVCNRGIWILNLSYMLSQKYCLSKAKPSSYIGNTVSHMDVTRSIEVSEDFTFMKHVIFQ